MPGLSSHPELDDVVYGYLVTLSNKWPVSAKMVTLAINRDIPGSTDETTVRASLDSLEEQGLVERERLGYSVLSRKSALRKQLEMDEVVPFTREFGETAEAHEDKVWDFRTALTKPGGRWGPAPTSHFFYKDKPWTGLTQESIE